MYKIGKIDLNTFEKFILKRLGKKNPHILIPPLTGVDAGIIDIGNDNVLIIAEDPIFPIPHESLKTFGWYVVHIGASDIAVMGVKPQYMTYTLLMTPETKDQDFKMIIDSIHETAKELEISIVGGHTGYYPTVTMPIIGGITVFSQAHKNDYVTPKGARIGDKVILTKGPAIEATGLLALIYEEELKMKYSESVVQDAKSFLKQMTVVKDALLAKEYGGVTAMHDATEGGVIGGLFEVANAADVGMIIEESQFVMPESVSMVMEYLHMDPLEAISEGSLIITCVAEKASGLIDYLKKENIPASIIGEVVLKKQGRMIRRINGRELPLLIPKQDPFWPAFFKGLENK